MSLTDSELELVHKFATEYFSGDPIMPSDLKLAQKILMAKRWNAERGKELLRQYQVLMTGPWNKSHQNLL